MVGHIPGTTNCISNDSTPKKWRSMDTNFASCKNNCVSLIVLSVENFDRFWRFEGQLNIGTSVKNCAYDRWIKAFLSCRRFRKKILMHLWLWLTQVILDGMCLAFKCRAIMKK